MVQGLICGYCSMKVESRIHCGHVISTRNVECAVLTETGHDPGSRLKLHAHSAPHVAILLAGSYFERIGTDCFLRLPGDRVHYPQLLEHENRFGRLPSRCLNIESQLGLEAYALNTEPRVSELAIRTRNLAESGKVTCLSSAAKELGYHPVYVSRVFRKSYGVSLGEFIKSCRVR